MKERIFALIKEAEKLRDAAQYRGALKLFQKALVLSRRADDLDGILDSTLAMADIQRMTGDFDGAVGNYSEALEACEALGNRITAADCMVGMGLSLRAMGMWKESVKFISAARKTYRKERDEKGVAFSLWAEAGALRVAGRIGKAIEKFNESKDIFSSLRFSSGIAYSLCGLGGAHRVAGKYGESMDYYRKANEIFTVEKDTFGRAYSHCGIGNAYRMTHNLRDAMAHFRKATALYEKIGDMVSYSYTLWSVANVHKMKSDFASARLHLRKAMGNFRKTKDPRGIIYCAMTLGEIEFLEGKRKPAEKKVLVALESAERHGFALETLHARSLLSLMRGESGQSGRLREAYRKIGVEAHPLSLPVAMP
ncbi:MAG: tetratricopeptide repeat protein [Alphaproteobacteria bacterium]|uniref:Tetratricopeptide repeat protein n=1 Tax=Candidatus Nitrobium versatile TaxID=2884831 RepID=A0A953JAJ5_9BACT|nr:tetratricopeptide repeat protein [Candidatus Nitrobium versatile]